MPALFFAQAALERPLPDTAAPAPPASSRPGERAVRLGVRESEAPAARSLLPGSPAALPPPRLPGLWHLATECH